MIHRFFFILFAITCSTAMIAKEPVLERNTQPPLDKRKLRMAVCYWGLTRSTKIVYQSHYDYIFKVLEANDIDYDVFMHTWRLKGKQKINTYESHIAVDYEEYKLLNPKYYKIELQSDFTDGLDFHQYFYPFVWNLSSRRQKKEEWRPQLILNHLIALESQKRVTNMMLESGNQYDLIMYVRPDACFTSRLVVSDFLGLKDNEIVIPNFDHHEGYNDRFAILTTATAPLYAKRIDHIADFRKNHGRIVSEKYVKYVCDENHFNVIFTELCFDLVRPASL